MKAILERKLPDPRRLRVARGGADLARVRALVDDDRRRLPAAAADVARGACSETWRADARASKTLMKSNGGAMLAAAAAETPIQTAMSGPAGGMTATEHVARSARRAERAHARHGRHERRRRHPRRRRAAAHDRVRDRVGPAGRGAADRHQVDRRRRRLDRVGRRGRLPARRAAERRRRSPGPICYGRGGTEVDRHRREPAARAGSTPTTSSPAGCGSTRGAAPEAMEALGEPHRPGAARARRVDRRDREREHGERDQDGLARAGPRSRAASRCSPSAAPARCTPRRSRACSGIPQVIVPLYPGVFSALGLLLADIRVDKVWTQAFRSNDVDAALVEPPVRPHHASARSPSCAQEGFAGEPEIRRAINMRYFGQNYEHEVEIDDRRARRRGARAGVPPLRRAARRALRLRDRRRGDRARQLQGDRDRHAPAARLSRTTATERRSARQRAARCTSAGTGWLDATVVHRASLSSRARRSPALPSIEEEGSTTFVEPGMTRRAQRAGRARDRHRDAALAMSRRRRSTRSR